MAWCLVHQAAYAAEGEGYMGVSIPYSLLFPGATIDEQRANFEASGIADFVRECNDYF